MHTQFGTGIATGEFGEATGREATTQAFDRIDADRVDFCQVFCSSTYDAETVLTGVRAVIGSDADLIGCTSTAEFTEAGVVEPGVAVGLVTSESMTFETRLGTGIGADVSGAVTEALSGRPTETDLPYVSAVVLHDGLRGVGEQLALAVQRKLGPQVSFAGGAASDNYQMESTSVFCGDEVAEDALAVALIASEQRPVIAVNHGHVPISDPVEVTESEGNVVTELDGRPAFEVWRDAVRERARAVFDVDVDEIEEMTSLSRRLMGEFEFGIDQGDGYKIRWPGVADVETGALEFAVDIPEGLVFRVMHGEPDDQIASAREAVAEALELAGDREMAGGFIFDCACREIILGDRFGEAVDTMNETLDLPLTGFATYGEIAMQMGQMTGFHNTTTVVMLLPDR